MYACIHFVSKHECDSCLAFIDKTMKYARFSQQGRSHVQLFSNDYLSTRFYVCQSVLLGSFGATSVGLSPSFLTLDI